jgi:hypothetical protein
MTPNVREQQIRLMAVLKEKDGQVQAALTRNCALNADLAVALEKIKELEERIHKAAPPPPAAKEDAVEAVPETFN